MDRLLLLLWWSMESGRIDLLGPPDNYGRSYIMPNFSVQAALTAFFVLFSLTNTIQSSHIPASNVIDDVGYFFCSSKQQTIVKKANFKPQLHKQYELENSHCIMYARLRGGGEENSSERLLKEKSSTQLQPTGKCISSNASGKILADREESLVHYDDADCKVGNRVMISRNFTKEEWAKLYVGKVGTLMAPTDDKGVWTASFGNTTANFRVGLDGASQLAYFNEKVPENHYRLAAAIIAVNGNASDAKAIFETALAIDPNNVNCLSGYGMLIHSKFHDCPGAEEHFKRALALAPRHVDTLSNYGAVLLDEFKRDFKARASPRRARDPGCRPRGARRRAQGAGLHSGGVTAGGRLAVTEGTRGACVSSVTAWQQPCCCRSVLRGSIPVSVLGQE